MDQVFIQHRFTIEEDGLTFSDALIMPKEEYDALNEEDIANMKHDRYTKWRAFLSEMSQPEEGGNK